MSQFDAFGTPGSVQGDGSATGNGSSFTGALASSSNTGSATPNPAPAPKPNAQLLQFYKNPQVWFERSRQGKMTPTQVLQTRNLFFNNYTQFLLHAALQGRPNPYNDIPDALNPSLESSAGPALIKPAEWAVKLSLGEQQVNIRLAKAKEMSAAAAAASASTDASGAPAQTSPNTGTGDGNDTSALASIGGTIDPTIGLSGSGPPSRTASPAPSAASVLGGNAASARKYFIPNELAKLNALSAQDRSKLLDEHPILKEKYEYTIKQFAEMKRNREAAAAAQNASADSATSDSQVAGEGSGTDGFSAPPPLVPPADAPPTTEANGANAPAALLPDVTKFNLSLPGFKGKKKDAGSPVKAEGTGEMNGNEVKGATSTTELADDADLDGRFGGEPTSIEMARGGSGSGSGSSQGQSLAKARLQSQVNAGTALELPSPFNLATSGAGPSSGTKPQYPGALTGTSSMNVPAFPSAVPSPASRFSKAPFALQSRAHPPPTAIPLEPEGMRRKRKVRELFKEVAPGMEMEIGVDEVFDDLIDTFLRDVIAGGAQCAKHRKVDGIELKDVGLYMHHSYNLQVPGYDTLIPVKQSIPVGEPDRRGRPKGIVPRMRRPGGDGDVGAAPGGGSG